MDTEMKDGTFGGNGSTAASDMIFYEESDETGDIGSKSGLFVNYPVIENQDEWTRAHMKGDDYRPPVSPPRRSESHWEASSLLQGITQFTGYEMYSPATSIKYLPPESEYSNYPTPDSYHFQPSAPSLSTNVEELWSPQLDVGKLLPGSPLYPHHDHTQSIASSVSFAVPQLEIPLDASAASTSRVVSTPSSITVNDYGKHSIDHDETGAWRSPEGQKKFNDNHLTAPGGMKEGETSAREPKVALLTRLLSKFHPGQRSTQHRPADVVPDADYGTCFTSHAGAKLFQLMDIRSDRQDLSFVEKIILPRKQIISFCETLHGECTGISLEGDLSLNFERLDQSSFNVIGFYGSKDVLVECFVRGGFITSDPNDEVFARMKADKLRPGLYALLHGGFLFVMYWHLGDVLPKASRRDISCNFVRYLVDLCDSLFILLEGDAGGIRESLTGAIKAQRTKKPRFENMKVQKLVTENKVEIPRGLDIPLVYRGSTSSKLRSYAGLPFDSMSCDGSRFGILSSETVPSGNAWRLQEKSLKLKDVDLSTGLPMFHNKSVDFRSTDLRYQDMSLFLQFSGCPDGQRYVHDLDELEAKKQDLQFEYEEQMREGEFLGSLETVGMLMEEFVRECIQSSPRLVWEEAVLGNGSLGDLQNLLTTVEEGSANAVQFLWNTTKSLLIGPKQTLEPQLKQRNQTLRGMEKHIFTWMGTFDKPHYRFIFPNDKILMQPTRRRGSGSQIFTVERTQGRQGPIFYKHRVFLRGLQSMQSKEVEFLNSSGSVEGPVVTNMPLRVKFIDKWRAQEGDYTLGVVPDNQNAGGLQEWVDMELQRHIPQLSKKAILLSYIKSIDVNKFQDEQTVQVLLQLPITEFLQVLVRNSPVEYANHIRETWDRICKGTFENSTLVEVVVIQCAIVYKSLRENVLTFFRTWCGKYMKGLLQNWIHLSYSLKREDLKLDRPGKLDDALKSLKRRKPQSGRKVVKLHSCILLNRYGDRIESDTNVRQLLRSVKDAQDYKIRVNYEEETVQKEMQRWLVQDLSPAKVDLDKLEENPNHIFKLTSNEPREVLTLEVSTKKLLRLAYLRTGQFLAFVLSTHHDKHNQALYVSLITLPGKEDIVHTMKQGYHLIAFDEQSRFLALYDKTKRQIKIYRFEEGYKHLDFSGAELYLEGLTDFDLTWMDLVPGRAEVVFADSDNTIRVFEMGAQGMVRPKEIKLPGAFAAMQVTKRGPCLLVFNKIKKGTDGTPGLNMEVYWISDESMSHVSTSPIFTFSSKSPTDVAFHVAVRAFGPQEQLLLRVADQPNTIRSYVLKITLGSDEFDLSSDYPSNLVKPEQLGSGLALDYMYHVYEKFSTNPPMAKQYRALSCYLVLSAESELQDECVSYLDSSFNRVRREKGKNFHGLDKQVKAKDISEVPTVIEQIAMTSQPHGKRGHRRRSMGDWIRQLLCLVPIQIARAENNALIPLVDGLELSADVDYDNTRSLASLLRFGFYDAVFASWHDRPIKIISSMGKQSSGKSYVLNHLSGSLLDVSGGRCTDGVWMTVRIYEEDAQGCMYVLLDFEGVGTYERSDQEDMLLSVLNAAISNITIYNKKETETVFARFQDGVQLVTDDEKLFSGLFFMVLKDVGEHEMEELRIEVKTKIRKILANTNENFLTKMYDGRVSLGFMAMFDTADYYKSIDEIYDDQINDAGFEVTYTDGRNFSTDLKLLIAQLRTLDWRSMDSKRLEWRVHLINTHLESAISHGSLDTQGNEINLADFDSQVEVEDAPIQVDGMTFNVLDTGLKLNTVGSGDTIDDILLHVKGLYQSTVERTGENDESWHTGFADFLERLTDRRKHRVLEWISYNTAKFQGHEEIDRIKLQAASTCTEVQHKLSVCSVSCKLCFLRCTKVKGHSQVSEHSCLGTHKCSRFCDYCVLENPENENQNLSSVVINKCADPAGHQGNHDCRSKSHTCQERCINEKLAGNCNKICAGTIGHSGDHICNSMEHKCGEKCGLHSCSNPCVTPFEIRDHSPHACHEKFCTMQCSMKGCNRICASKDHFHDNDLSAEHYCGMAHPCPESCEVHGNCGVAQDLLKVKRTHRGKYQSFEYEYVAEQSGIRKPCCKEIPPLQTSHEGPHSHTLDDRVVHFCDTRCPACGYFCTQPYGHGGLHNTVHGNMRNTKFTSQHEKIDMGDRVYAWDESGAAEMCSMFCKKQGRGHAHLVLCPATRERGVCYGIQLPVGARHEIIRRGPDFDVAKDEMTHAGYWSHIRFVDPSSTEDQVLFSSCGHECPSSDHEQRTSKGKGKLSTDYEKSFCTLAVWHAPLTDSEEDRKKFNRGHVTKDGHHMSCSHGKPANIVFVIDRSSSMNSKDITPQYAQFQKSHNNRLGCVYEAILRFVKIRAGLQLGVPSDAASVILFNHSSTVITPVELDVMDESIIGKLLLHIPYGGTTFSTGLKQAERILQKSKAQGDERPPVVVFLSDGENDDSDEEETLDTVKSMRSNLCGLQIFTIKFGSEKEQIFERMADKGKAYSSIDRLMLSNTFVQIAKSLKPKSGGLIVNNSY